MLNKNKKLKKLGIISIITLVFITTLTTSYFQNCNYFIMQCNPTFLSTVHILIVTIGLIGLIYCFYILRNFNKTVDNEILKDFEKIVLDDNKKD